MKKYKFTIKGNPYDVRIKELEDSKATLEVNGTEYEVEIHSDEVIKSKTPKLVRKPVEKTPTEQGNIMVKNTGGKAVKAPLPGNIFKVNVKVGDTVKKGDVLLVMEAMKMENDVLAEKDGAVSALHVKEGDAVLQGDPLLDF